MEILQVDYEEDFGKEWTYTFFSFEKFNLFQFTFLYNDFSTTFNMIFRINILPSLMTLAISILRFEFQIDFFQKKFRLNNKETNEETT